MFGKNLVKAVGFSRQLLLIVILTLMLKAKRYYGIFCSPVSYLGV